MPLASPITADDMDVQVQYIVSSLPQSLEGVSSWSAAQKWAPVATAFFSSAIVPAVTPAGIAAGEAAFVASAESSSPAPNQMTEQALSAGFLAYAAAMAAPGNCLPTAPVIHAPPPSPPSLDLSALPASETSISSTTVLHSLLTTWAALGTQTTPGTPPVIVPWS